MTKTLTRRGFVSMLASVPLVVVAAPKIFLPESQYDQDMRLYYEYVSRIQRDLKRSMESYLNRLLIRQGKIPYNDEGYELVRQAVERTLKDESFPRLQSQYTVSIPSLGIAGQSIQGFNADRMFQWP